MLRTSNKTMAKCKPALRQKINKGELHATVFRGFALDFFLSFASREFLRHGFLKFSDIHAVAFGGVRENVVAAGGGSLIGRIQKADFQKQLAEFRFIIRAYLLDQKFLCGCGVLLCLYLVPLRQIRHLAVGEMADQVVADCQQVGLL